MNNADLNRTLTKEELENLTGYQWASKQRAKLDESGIFFVTSGVSGFPKTTWFHVNNPKHMRSPTPIEEEPDFSSLGARHG